MFVIQCSFRCVVLLRLPIRGVNLMLAVGGSSLHGGVVVVRPNVSSPIRAVENVIGGA